MIIPGQSKIACRHIPGGEDTAANAVQIVQADNTGNVNALSMGGLTKLEMGSLMIAAGLAANPNGNPSEIPPLAVLLAREVLAAAAPKPSVPQRGNGVLQ